MHDTSTSAASKKQKSESTNDQDDLWWHLKEASPHTEMEFLETCVPTDFFDKLFSAEWPGDELRAKVRIEALRFWAIKRVLALKSHETHCKYDDFVERFDHMIGCSKLYESIIHTLALESWQTYEMFRVDVHDEEEGGKRAYPIFTGTMEDPFHDPRLERLANLRFLYKRWFFQEPPPELWNDDAPDPRKVPSQAKQLEEWFAPAQTLPEAWERFLNPQGPPKHLRVDVLVSGGKEQFIEWNRPVDPSTTVGALRDEIAIVMRGKGLITPNDRLVSPRYMAIDTVSGCGIKNGDQIRFYVQTGAEK
jgi:hypothetical protein